MNALNSSLPPRSCRELVVAREPSSCCLVPPAASFREEAWKRVSGGGPDGSAQRVLSCARLAGAAEPQTRKQQKRSFTRHLAQTESASAEFAPAPLVGVDASLPRRSCDTRVGWGARGSFSASCPRRGVRAAFPGPGLGEARVRSVGSARRHGARSQKPADGARSAMCAGSSRRWRARRQRMRCKLRVVLPSVGGGRRSPRALDGGENK